MYAVIETGGKQYRVEVGTELEVELLDVEPGKTVTIDRVLLIADGDESTIGTYTLDEETHSVTQRLMGVFQYQEGTVTPLAYFDIGGADFRMA